MMGCRARAPQQPLTAQHSVSSLCIVKLSRSQPLCLLYLRAQATPAQRDSRQRRADKYGEVQKHAGRHHADVQAGGPGALAKAALAGRMDQVRAGHVLPCSLKAACSLQGADARSCVLPPAPSTCKLPGSACQSRGKLLSPRTGWCSRSLLGTQRCESRPLCAWGCV